MSANNNPESTAARAVHAYRLATPSPAEEYEQAKRDFNRMRDDGSLPAAQDDPAKGLIDNLLGAYEWGYRDPVEGGFVADDAPFRAGENLAAATRQIADLRERLETARIARVEHNRQHHEERMARLAAEADAATLEAALRRIKAGREKQMEDGSTEVVDLDLDAIEAIIDATLTQRGA